MVFRTLIARLLIQPKKQARKFILEIEWIFNKLRKLKSSSANSHPEKSVRMEISLLHPVGA